MAPWNARKGLPCAGSDKESTSPGTSPLQTPKATFRAGFWYAGNVRCKDYRDALTKTLLAAGLVAEKPLKPPSEKQYPRPERLEVRVWWQTFLADHTARERARNIAEASRRDREEECHSEAFRPANVAQPKTLRERAVVALRTRGAGA